MDTERHTTGSVLEECPPFEKEFKSKQGWQSGGITEPPPPRIEKSGKLSLEPNLRPDSKPPSEARHFIFQVF